MYPRRFTHLSALVAVTATTGVLIVGLAAPAMATTADFTVGPGTLLVSQGTSVTLPGFQPSINPTTITGVLGDITVTDTRGTNTPTWAASVYATPFVNGSVSAGATATYTSGSATSTGGPSATGSFTTSSGVSITAASPGPSVFSAAGLTGNNTATWKPSISVTIPATVTVGTYTSTITHSIA